MDEIVADRLLQSVDFENGRKFSEFLTGASVDVGACSPRIRSITTPNGVVVYGRSGAATPAAEYVVFDCQQAGLTTDKLPLADIVLYYQRTLRFASKYWNQRTLSLTEILVPLAGRAIVFPHPISQKTGVRITIDLNPDNERLAKRDKAGRYLLVYRTGTDDNDALPSLTVFRKFLDEVRTAETALAEDAPAASANIPSFQAYNANTSAGRLDLHQGYDLWARAVTDDQRRFIEAPLLAPMRIEGPAGTGKTLALAMKSMHLMQANETAVPKVLFVTHSEASRRSIESVLQAMGGERFLTPIGDQSGLQVATLQGLCAQILRQELSETELIDPDAYDAKQMQFLYVEQALQAARTEWLTYERFASPSFREFITTEDEQALVPLFQHEIGVVIKGRAAENYDAYKKLPAMKYGLPLQTEGDRSFVWRVFALYRDDLVAGGQFDTDDVMLSAIGQLSTPIWRRRRAREGYDYLLIDETHLFNMNELSVFHHLTRSEDRFSIAFAIDRAQSVGDRGWDSTDDMKTLVPDQGQRESTKRVHVKSVFRSSPEIVNLAFAVTSSGASLFTNFEDPLSIANSSLSFEEERKCASPLYREFISDEEMIEQAFVRADAMTKEMNIARADLAIIAFTEDLFERLVERATAGHKPFEVLKERGNVETVRRAKQAGKFVLSMPDYVGGLEFDAALLVGVDNGRVPSSDPRTQQTRAFLNYSAHNRLYVAITRARYRVEILGLRDRGPSPILKGALSTGTLLRTS